MSHNEFNHILATINALSSEQMQRLLHELESKMAAVAKAHEAAGANGSLPEESAFEVASRAGLIGCIKGAPRTPTDLSTNPTHMEAFGRG